jgi:hypothetical protein
MLILKIFIICYFSVLLLVFTAFKFFPEKIINFLEKLYKGF